MQGQERTHIKLELSCLTNDYISQQVTNQNGASETSNATH